MKDQLGRTIDYIRISVTDRCNLRCVYCMPQEGMPNIPHEEILRFDEILRLVGILAGQGVSRVKITGGEPLVRKGVVSLIRDIKHIDGINSVTITTNGVLLSELLEPLAEAGIDGITVSLDTLDPEHYLEVTRRDELDRVVQGIKLAIHSNRIPLKINCVPVFGMNEDIFKLAELAREHDISVRFIEMMPIGFGQEFPFVEENQLRSNLETRFGALTPCFDVKGNGPCLYYRAEGFKGTFGFISAVSHKFCGSCNRVRLTAEGFLKTCLQYDYGVDLKKMLRSGSSDEEISEAMMEAVYLKAAEHNFHRGEIEEDMMGREHRGMSQIGG
ncbi:MAG: GTP 3',8-cyclase MoaA [Clostridium sp.]